MMSRASQLASIRGRKAKRAGQTFEQIIINEAYRSNLEIMRVPDGCKSTGAKSFIRIKSPFDFVLVDRSKENTIFCDVKSTQSGTFVPSLIKQHQVKELKKFSGLTKIKAGYIINFEKHSKVVFFPVTKLIESLVTRKGLRPSDGISLGHKLQLDFRIIFQ
jgi:penicillin-binding protein-related factor A (putative recombinase)